MVIVAIGDIFPHNRPDPASCIFCWVPPQPHQPCIHQLFVALLSYNAMLPCHNPTTLMNRESDSESCQSNFIAASNTAMHSQPPL